jgi:hypothetical protein
MTTTANRPIRTTTGGAHGHISDRQPFTTSGALSGRAPHGQHFGPWDSGRLPREHVDSFQRATYAVFSYATPIAWVVDDAWVIPATRYSLTTSRHQSSARHGAHLSGLEFAAQTAA